jgi:hypothetical protein
MKKMIVLVMSLLAIPGCVKDPSEGNGPQREMIVFAPAGELNPELLGRLAKHHQAGDLMTVIELTDEGPKKVGTRTKVARMTAKEAQKAGADQRSIAEFLSKPSSSSNESPRMDIPTIFRVASECRKTDLPLDVVVMGAPIHTAEGVWDCSKGYWISDGCITQTGTPFSQTYENLSDSTFWFIPKGWPWGKGDNKEVHEQAWIRATQLLAAKHGAKLGAVSPDTESMARNIEDKDIKLAAAKLSDDEKVTLYDSIKWKLLVSDNGKTEVVSVEPSAGNVRPVDDLPPSWVQQVIDDAVEAGRSVVAVCWRIPTTESEPIDIDLYSIHRDGDCLFFAEPEKTFGRYKVDIKASNSRQSNQVDERNWEVIEVDGKLSDYEWCLNHYSGSSASKLNMTLIHRDADSNANKTLKFTWEPKQADEGAGFLNRATSASWRALPELK